MTTKKPVPSPEEAVAILERDYCAHDKFTPEDCIYQAVLAALTVQREALPEGHVCQPPPKRGADIPCDWHT